MLKDNRHLHLAAHANRVVSDSGLSHRTTPFIEIRHFTLSPSMNSCEELLESDVLAVELDGLSLRSFSSSNPPWNRFESLDARFMHELLLQGTESKDIPIVNGEGLE